MKEKVFFGIMGVCVLLALSALTLVAGCGTANTTTGTAAVAQPSGVGTVTTSGIAAMTPKQKAVFFGSFYKAQYDSYKARQDTTMTDAERQVMKVRW